MLATPRATHRLFRIAGVPVYADNSAALLLVLILVMNGRGGALAIVASLIIAAVAFSSLIAHELGHAFAVRRLGYGSSEIVLGGLGGVCKWYGRPTRGDSIKIALAGPAVSLGLGALAIAAYAVLEPAIGSVMPLRVLVISAAFLNIAWGVFNLLPIFPMDGGRALRSALGFRYPSADAIRISLIVSAAVGVTAAVVAYLYGEWIVSLILAMLLVQNWNEWQSATR